MNILLTGVSGCLGRHVAHRNAGDWLVTLGLTPGDRVKCDLASTVPVIDTADLVVDAAEKAHSVSRSKTERRAFHYVNATGTANLLVA